MTSPTPLAKGLVGEPAAVPPKLVSAGRHLAGVASTLSHTDVSWPRLLERRHPAQQVSSTRSAGATAGSR